MPKTIRVTLVYEAEIPEQFCDRLSNKINIEHMNKTMMVGLRYADGTGGAWYSFTLKKALKKTSEEVR